MNPSPASWTSGAEGGRNPFTDPDRRQLWEILVRHDVEGFLAEDWSRVADDFMADGFVGLDAGFQANPDEWRLAFPDLVSYEKAWLEQSRQFARIGFSEDPLACLYASITLDPVEIRGNSAVVHKKFKGSIRRQDGQRQTLRWQSLFFCRKSGGLWKIGGFVGYLPYAFGGT